jgi:hypothetical protein
MAWKHKQSADRRLDRLEKARAAPARIRFVWQGENETLEQVEAKMRAMVASGKASPRDRLIIHKWNASADGGAGK